MSKPDPLPRSWVERIFQKLSVVYGRDFLGRYEGLELSDVFDDWAVELGGFQANPDAIKHALSHLPPSKPPFVLEFAALCRQAPARTLAVLPAPKPTAEDKRMASQLVEKYRVQVGAHDSRAWAHALKAREEGGEVLSATQKSMWRDALREAA